MFILYAVLIGLALGLLLGGRLYGLAEIRFRWAWLVVVALLIQVVLFSEQVADNIDPTLGIAIYVGSTAMALVGVLANLHIPGMVLVVLGAASNLAAILANGGYMPADPGALEALGRDLGDDYSNSTVVADPVLAPLTDIFAMPSSLPFANVFSIGDVLIGAGVVVAMVVAMRRAARQGRSSGSGDATTATAGLVDTTGSADGRSLLARARARLKGEIATAPPSPLAPPPSALVPAVAAVDTDDLPAVMRSLAEPVEVPAGLADDLLVKPGSPSPLRRLDHAATFGMSKAAATAVRAEQDRRLAELRERLRIDGRGGLLVVVQGVDQAGVEGAVRRLVEGLGSRGCAVTAFDRPSADELGRDFLWRYHAAVPRRGSVAVFQRSYYEDVTAARVTGEVSEATWRARYRHIRDWERMLVDEGTTVVKLFLSIDRAEHRARLQALVDDPAQRWRITTAAMDAYERWDAHLDAFEEAIAQTSTDWAPWHVVPAGRRRLRDLAVAEIASTSLERALARVSSPVPALEPTDAVAVADRTAAPGHEAPSEAPRQAAPGRDAPPAVPERVAASAPAGAAPGVVRQLGGWPADDPQLPSLAAQGGL